MSTRNFHFSETAVGNHLPDFVIRRNNRRRSGVDNTGFQARFFFPSHSRPTSPAELRRKIRNNKTILRTYFFL